MNHALLPNVITSIVDVVAPAQLENGDNDKEIVYVPVAPANIVTVKNSMQIPQDVVKSVTSLLSLHLMSCMKYCVAAAIVAHPRR